MMTEKRGISTFIATLLLMVLAVSAGVVIYAYTMGYLGGYGGTDTLGAMSLDQGNMLDDSTITVYIRNTGKTTLNLIELDGAACYVDGELAAITTGSEIEEGVTSPITITAAQTLEVGKTYNVKLIATDNTQLSFNLKCKAAPAP
jgi:hypothetical protein